MFNINLIVLHWVGTSPIAVRLWIKKTVSFIELIAKKLGSVP